MQVETVDYRDLKVGQNFVRSLRETGFAILKNHPLPAELLARIYQDWIGFFHSEEKYDYLVKDRKQVPNGAGFTPADISETAVGHGVKDLKEFYHVFSDDYLPSYLAQDALIYLDTAFSLGEVLLGWIGENIPQQVAHNLSAPLTGILSRNESLLRVLHYPPMEGNENPNAVRAAAHEDINMLTLLPVADQPGLQVKDQAGNWHDVAGNQGDLIINAGDMLSELTTGYFPSTTHRVINPEGASANVSRISIPYFLTPRLDIELSEKYTAGSYLSERLQDINR